MTRQAANQRFLQTGFLDGANAVYVEEMQERYQLNPGSVSDEWRQFFESLKDERPRGAVDSGVHFQSANGNGSSSGPSWGLSVADLTPSDELTRALAGEYDGVERTTRDKLQRRAHEAGFEIPPAAAMRATQDSIRARMLIRAYRVLGHLAADLDPLGLADRKVHRDLKPETYGFTEADLDRPVFIDRALGFDTVTIRELLKILRRTYCRKIGFQFMHITSPVQRAWIQERIEGEEKDIRFTVQGKRAILNKLIEAESFEKFCDVRYTGTKRFGLDGGEAMVPALGTDHQTRRPARRQRDRARYGPSRALDGARQRHGQAAPRYLQRVQGRVVEAGRCRRLGRREVSPRRLLRPHLRRQQCASFVDGQSLASWKSSIPWCSARCAPSRISTAARRASVRR